MVNEDPQLHAVWEKDDPISDNSLARSVGSPASGLKFIQANPKTTTSEWQALGALVIVDVLRRAGRAEVVR